MHLNNVYIKALELPVCSALRDTITGHLIGYYTSLNLHGTENGESFILANQQPGTGDCRSQGPLWSTGRFEALPMDDSNTEPSLSV